MNQYVISYPSSQYNDLLNFYNVQIHPDIAVRREVERLPVKCANHKSGCPWTGKLKDHEVRQCSSLWFHSHNFLNLSHLLLTIANTQTSVHLQD